MKRFLKSNKGITGADAVLGVALAILFSGIIATLSYNIYVTTSSLKRSSKALEYITSTFEYVATQYYDNVTEDNIKNYISTKLDGKISINEGTPYKAQVSVTNYNQMEGNTDKLDLVKEITMSVTYKLGDKDQTIEIKTAKSREKLEVPNKPDLDKIAIIEGQYIYPIKYANGNWKVTSKDDTNWYDYNRGLWGTVVVTTTQKSIGDVITYADGTIYLWVPRFEYTPNPNSEDKYVVNFLYKNTNKRIVVKEGITKIEDRELKSVEDSIPNEFIQNKNTGVWIIKRDLIHDPYLFLNKSKYKLDDAKYSGKLW
ncbi:MAG: hypothetical protein ACI4VO_05940 [Clostridia bacterium]